MFYDYTKSAIQYFASAIKVLLVLLVVVVAFGAAFWIGDLVGRLAGKLITIIL